MSQQTIPADVSLTFTDYFKLNAYVDRVLDSFGYTFEAKSYQLPKAEIDPDRVARLAANLEENLPYLSLDAEISRREFLIGPVLLEANHYCHARIRSEYPLAVNDRLKGSIDYFLEGNASLLVVEAKNADLTRGFTQLAVELVAVDQSHDHGELIYGAVSVGDIWRFGVLHREAKRVTQDLNLFRVPADLMDLIGVLVGILNG